MARVRLSVDIEPELKHQLAVLAALREVTMSEIVVEAVRGVLAEEGIGDDVRVSAGAAGVLRKYAEKKQRSREKSAWADRTAHDLY